MISNQVSLGLDEFDFRKPTLEIYEKYFQTPFIEATALYYASESEKYISENSVIEYMKKAEARLAQEAARVDAYLHASSKPALVGKCEHVLIRTHLTPLQDEFQNLLDQDKIEDLGRMYGLLSRIPEGLDSLRSTFEEHVRKQGFFGLRQDCLQ